eukprot:1312297-Rhodomonas_salina.1
MRPNRSSGFRLSMWQEDGKRMRWTAVVEGTWCKRSSLAPDSATPQVSIGRSAKGNRTRNLESPVPFLAVGAINADSAVAALARADVVCLRSKSRFSVLIREARVPKGMAADDHRSLQEKTAAQGQEPHLKKHQNQHKQHHQRSSSISSSSRGTDTSKRQALTHLDRCWSREIDCEHQPHGGTRAADPL